MIEEVCMIGEVIVGVTIGYLIGQVSSWDSGGESCITSSLCDTESMVQPGCKEYNHE